MAEMESLEKAFCRSRPYRAFARRFLLPWGLQGAQLTGEVLELGSGSGAMAAEILAEFPQLRLVATDVDPDMVGASETTLARFGARVHVQQADASALPFADGRFEAVLAFAMLHHVGDWRQAAIEAIRVLRPGGRFIGYDLVDAIPFHLLHRAHGQSSRMLQPGQLETVLTALPVRDVRTRRGLGLVLRFSATRSA